MRKISCRWINGQSETNLEIEWEAGKITGLKERADQGEFIGMPALIDIHTHGFRGVNSEASAEELRRLALAYALRESAVSARPWGRGPSPVIWKLLTSTVRHFPHHIPALDFWACIWKAPI